MKRIERIFSCLIIFLLIVEMIHYLGRIVRPVDTDIAFHTIETFHEMPENTIEVIGYGPSTMWRGLNVMEMYQKYGIGAYNYGCNWQHINTTSLFLQDSLRTQTPKLALIETYLVNDILMDINMDGEIYYTREIPNFEGKQAYLKQCFGDNKLRYLSYYMPLCAFHENWVNINMQSFYKNSDKTDFRKTMGYVSISTITPITLKNPDSFEQEELSETALSVLDEIVELCHKNQIEILFYTAPKEEEYKYSNAMKTFAKEHGCKYLNLYEYIEEIGINGETDFADEVHLNDNGAIKVADYLGNFIITHYEVTDMRMVSGNVWGKNI